VRLVLVVVLLALPWSRASPAFEETDFGTRSTGMGGLGCALPGECQAMLLNPAGLALMASPQFGAFYTRLYYMEELAHSSMCYGHPTSLGTPALFFSSFGTDPYQEFLLLFGYAYPLGRISVGGDLKLMRVQISEYGSFNSLGADLGLLGQISEGLDIGVSVQNVNNPKLAGDDLPSPLVGGLAISPAEGLIICTDVAQELGQGLDVRVGCEYTLRRHLALRCGFGTGPSSIFTWGASYLLGRLELGYGGRSHPVLDITHAFSVLFSFGPRASRGVFRLSGSSD